MLSTGDELIDDGSPLQPGQIRESNKTMLLPLVAEAGCEAIDLGVVRDDEAALEATLREAAASCDAIVTSGGVSMGEYDVVKAVLSRIADMRWMQIAIKPAKPFAFGLLDAGDRRTPVFGLPGNPVSSMVSFELFARPALRQMMGHPFVDRATVVGRRRRRTAPPNRRQDPLHPGFRRVRRRRPLPRRLRRCPGQPPVGGNIAGRCPRDRPRRRRRCSRAAPSSRILLSLA